MSVLELQLYDLLKIKLGEREASSLIEYIEVKSKEKSDTKFVEYKALQTKDIELLRNEIQNVCATKKDITEVRVEIKETKTEMIKWMFIFWIGQIAATFGLIMMYLKK